MSRLSLGTPFSSGLLTSDATFAANATKISLKAPSNLFQTTVGMVLSGERIPNDVTNISLWLDPSISSDTTSNGASVSTYTDRIFGNYAFTNTGSNRPTYSTTAINGKPGLVFTSASSQFLTGSGTFNVFVNPNGTLTQAAIFAVVNVTSISTNSATPYLNVSVFSDSAFGYFGIYLKSSGPTAAAYWYTGSVGETDATFSLSTNVLITYYVHGGNLYCQINNGTVNSSAVGSRSDEQAPLMIGHAATGYLNGAIGDIIVLNTYNANDVNDVQQYLRTKYSLW